MRFLSFLFFVILLFSATPLFAADLVPDENEFINFLNALKIEAVDAGISEVTVDAAFKNVKEPDKRVIELDRKQPEFNQDFTSYMGILVKEERIAKGRELMKQHRVMLGKIYKEYGIPPNIIIAFWGVESNYGTRKGKMSLMQSLTTLTYDNRRSKFFKAELMNALKILDRKERTVDTLVGGWAGAMGHFQFMPSTYLTYAIDFNGDGKKDIWDDFEEAAYSAANYLQRIGWKKGQLWGREVKLPRNFPYGRFYPQVKKPLSFWKKQGVTFASGKPLSTLVDFEAEIVLPEGRHGPAFLAYDNYRVIKRWNNSVLYALAVGLLSNQIAFHEPLIYKKGKYATPPLSGASVKKLQDRLRQLGYYSGTSTGILGPVTTRSIQHVQRDLNLTQDGYPTPSFLKKLYADDFKKEVEAANKKKATASKKKIKQVPEKKTGE